MSRRRVHLQGGDGGVQQLGLLGCGKRLREAAVRTLHAQDKEEKRSSERRQRRYKQKKNPFPCVLLPVYAGKQENSTEGVYIAENRKFGTYFSPLTLSQYVFAACSVLLGPKS